MIYLDNDDALRLLSMADTMDALRIGFDQLAARDAAHVPRLELWAPAEDDDAYHCLGAMSGTTKHYGISAMRVKSDVMSWPDGSRQEKFSVEPGTYCGFVLLFSTATGAPLALLNDGVLQRSRVGASAGIGLDHLANPGPARVGILGAGDMARVHLEAIALTRPVQQVSVYSPTKDNRELYAEEMSERLGLKVTAVDIAEDAVRGQDIVTSATNSMGPTIEPEWLDDGATVTCVTRREVGAALVERADKVIQLGAHSIGPETPVPDMEWPQSAAGGFIAGTEAERARLPWNHPAELRTFPTLIDVLRGDAAGRTTPDETILYINLGNQGVQFAAVGAKLYELAIETGVGSEMDRGRFLQDIRD